MSRTEPGVPGPLAEFPNRPVHELLPGIADVCRAYRLRPHDTVTVHRAYETAYENHAPTNTYIAARMLQGILPELEADPGRLIGGIGRDAYPFIEAMHGMRPELMAARSFSFRWSRLASELLMQDWERRHGRPFPLHEKTFRTFRGEVDPSLVPGAIENVARHFEQIGRPLEPGVQHAHVDIGRRGMLQEIVRHVFGVDATSHLARASVNAKHPRPERVHGYLYRDTSGDVGVVNYLPDDPARTFQSNQAIGYLESISGGPQGSVLGFTPSGPVATEPLRRPKSARVQPQWQNPKAVLAMRTAVLLAAHDHAAQYRGRPLAEIAAAVEPGHRRFVGQIRNLITQQGPYDRDLAAMLGCGAPTLVCPSEAEYRADPAKYATARAVSRPARPPRQPDSTSAADTAGTLNHDHLGRPTGNVRGTARQLRLRIGGFR